MTVKPVDPQDKQRVIQLNFCGEICELWADGALYLPSYKTLVVSDLHFEKVVLKKNKLICYFDTTSTNNFFQSDDFSRMIKQLQCHSKKGILKEKKQGENKRLLLSFEDVNSIEDALRYLKELQPTAV